MALPDLLAHIGAMAYLPTLRFTGQLSRDEHTIDVAFDGEVDDDGVLHLSFDPLPVSRETFALGGSGSDGTVPWAVLEGVAETGETIRSDTFYVTNEQHRSTETEATVTFQGACERAVITRTFPEPATFSQLILQFPRFRSFSWLHQEIDLGIVRMGGATSPDPAQPQRLAAMLALQRQGAAEPTWFAEAEARLIHILRVMSFASGVYLRPLVERRIVGDRDEFTIIRRKRTPEPFLEPFVFLNLEPIFTHAGSMDAGARERFAGRDATIQWLLAPGHYTEIRLMAAMTALENLVEDAFPGDASLFMKPSAFKKVASAVRELLRNLGVPDGMLAKIPELNRQSFADKLYRYYESRGVTLGDLDAAATKALINARNVVVHRGVYYDPTQEEQTDLWDHLLLARELVTRALLAELGFVGNYFSRLYGVNQQLRFPSCQRLTDDQFSEVPEEGTPAPGPADGASDAPRLQAGEAS